MDDGAHSVCSRGRRGRGRAAHRGDRTGAQRGLVAIDPAPCLGDDVAFEAIDLLLWQADDVDTITARVKLLAPAIGADTSHLLEWCTAFAAMIALELAESPTASPERVQTYMALAAQAPRT